MGDVTRILSAIEYGDPHAADELLSLIYAELRHIAGRKLARENPGQTLNATALVHEAYLRLFAGDARNQHWNSRVHFFAAAAEAMRRILIESARRKRCEKHGGGMQRVDLDVAEVTCRVPDDDLLALDEALSKFAAEDAFKAKLVQLRFFGGLSNEQAAEVLGISAATATRHWRYARAWLHREINKGEEPNAVELGEIIISKMVDPS